MGNNCYNYALNYTAEKRANGTMVVRGLVRGLIAFTLFILISSTFAQGGSPAQPPGADAGWYVFDPRTGLPRDDPSPPVAPGTTTSYLCWSGTGSLSSSGVLSALFQTGTNSVTGDDAHMNATGLLGTMGFSIANTNPAGGAALSQTDGELDFFRQSNGSFIGGITFTANMTAILGAPLAAQSSVRLSFPDGSLESATIILDTPDIFITTKFTNVLDSLGSPNGGVGCQIRNPAGGPAAPGASSQDRMMINGVDTNSPFGGNPVGNVSYFVRVSPVPEPGTGALLAVAGAATLSRRQLRRFAPRIFRPQGHSAPKLQRGV